MADVGTNKPGSEGDSLGTLYVVGTPIGNLADITYRAVGVLSRVDLIIGENVSRTRALCSRYNIRTKVMAFRRENQKTKTPRIVDLLASGRNIALVSDAGTPGLSDPGGLLVDAVSKARIDVRPIPGPCAVAGAVSVSGMPAENFLFLGFLPSKSGRRRTGIASLKQETRTTVFFEAPHRLRGTLGDMADILGDRQVMVAREMTKVFEEFIRGPSASVLDRLPDQVKGEITVVVEGAANLSDAEEPDCDLRKAVDALMMDGKISLREAAGRLSTQNGITYRRAYKICLDRKKVLQKRSEDGD